MSATNDDIFLVNIRNPREKGNPVIGQTQARNWKDPFSGRDYIVPAGYNPKDTIDRFSIKDKLQTLSEITPVDETYSGATLSIAAANALQLLDYRTGNQFDIQRGFNGKKFNGFVKEFTPIASFDVGLACAAVGASVDDCKKGGGHVNKNNARNNPLINTSGEYGNNPANIPNIEAGFAYYEKQGNPALTEIAIRLKNLGAIIQNPPDYIPIINSGLSQSQQHIR